MSDIFEELVKKAENAYVSNPEASKKLQELLTWGNRLSFKESFQRLNFDDPQELIILHLIHLCRLFATEEFGIEYTQYLSECIQWAHSKQMLTDNIFYELDIFFQGGYMKNVQKCENIPEFNRIYKIAQIMINCNADKESYYNIIKFKLTPLIWRSIRKIIEEKSDKQEMLEILYGINVAQHHGIPIENTAIHFMAVVQNYIISKTNFYGICDEPVKQDDEDVKDLLTSLNMVQIYDENLKIQLNSLIQRFGINPNPKEPEAPEPNLEITLDLIESNLIYNSQIYFQIFPNFQARVDLYTYNSLKIAVKKYMKKNEIPLDIEKIKIEINISMTLSKKANDDNCFLKYYGTKLVDDNVSLYMEYHPLTLDQKITMLANEQPQKGFDKENLKKLIRKLIHSFTIMEESNIYHRDIKPTNLLYSEAGEIKIIDFSVSEMKINDENTSTVHNYISVTGTPFFMAPEVHEAYINKQKRIEGWTVKADVFSLGMTILQMITLTKLDSLNFRNNNESLMKVIEAKVDDNLLKNLLKDMLNLDSNSRPTFAQCLMYFEAEETR